MMSYKTRQTIGLTLVIIALVCGGCLWGAYKVLPRWWSDHDLVIGEPVPEMSGNVFSLSGTQGLSLPDGLVVLLFVDDICHGSEPDPLVQRINQIVADYQGSLKVIFYDLFTADLRRKLRSDDFASIEFATDMNKEALLLFKVQKASRAMVIRDKKLVFITRPYTSLYNIEKVLGEFLSQQNKPKMIEITGGPIAPILREGDDDLQYQEHKAKSQVIWDTVGAIFWCIGVYVFSIVGLSGILCLFPWHQKLKR